MGFSPRPVFFSSSSHRLFIFFFSFFLHFARFFHVRFLAGPFAVKSFLLSRKRGFFFFCFRHSRTHPNSAAPPSNTVDGRRHARRPISFPIRRFFARDGVKNIVRPARVYLRGRCPNTPGRFSYSYTHVYVYV